MKIIITCALSFLASVTMIAQQSSNLTKLNFSENVYVSNLDFSSLPTKVNSEKNEIAIGTFRQKFLVLSNKRYQHAKVKKDQNTQQEIPNILCVDVYYDHDLKNPNLFSRLLKSDANEGFITFNSEYNIAYLTRKKDMNSNEYYLYKSELKDENKGIWSEPQEMLIDGKSLPISSPRLSSDDKTLYFAANLPNGYGGLDIYKVSTIDHQEFKDITNLGPLVNSSSNETSPIEFDNALYFSSNIPGGFGGYDIYRVNSVSSNPTYKINLGPKLNTPEDELNIIPMSSNQGYYTSNKESNGKSYDVYRYTLHTSDVVVETVFMDKDNKRIKDLDVVVKDGNDNVLFKGKTNQDGLVNVSALPYSNLNYEINSVKYLNTDPLLYETHNESKTQYKAFALDENFNEDKKDLNAVKVLTISEEYIIYFDFDKATIKDSEIKKLEKLAKLINKTPSNITIEGHTDTKGSDSYNYKLSNKRAQSVVDYLAKNGVNKKLLAPKGLGESNPIINCEDCTKGEDALNRRVIFVVD